MSQKQTGQHPGQRARCSNSYTLWKNAAQRETGAVAGDYVNVIYGRITMWQLGPILTRQVYGTSFHHSQKQTATKITRYSDCK